MVFHYLRNLLAITYFSNSERLLLLPPKEKIVGNNAKGRISKRVFQENKARQIFRKTNISYPRIHTRTCAYQWVRNVCFSENLAHFVFLKHPFWDSHFCVITDEMTKNTKNTFTGEMHSLNANQTLLNIAPREYDFNLFQQTIQIIFQ